MFKAIKFSQFTIVLTVSLFAGDTIAEDIDQLSNGMIQLIKQIQNDRASTGIVKRFNQGKSLGCFDAEFKVSADLPAGLRKGLFKKAGRYDAQVRFANAVTTDDSEKDLR